MAFGLEHGIKECDLQTASSNRKGNQLMIPLTTRDATDWSMICAYLRLDDEGRKRGIEEIEYQTSRMMKEREEERRAWLSKDI